MKKQKQEAHKDESIGLIANEARLESTAWTPNFHLEIHMGTKVALQKELSLGQPSEGQQQPHTQSYLEVQVVSA